MREQPWHLRRATTQHQTWYRNLIEVHSLTTSWLRETDFEASAHTLPRGIAQKNPEVAESLWMLDSLASEGGRAKGGLEALLDDTTPEDVLSRLERTVWAAHALTVASILDRAVEQEKPAVLNQMEQDAWKAGRECALVRWPDLPDEVGRDLRGILAAYRNSPLSGMPNHDALLIVRSVPEEINLELLSCPHQSSYIEVRAAADFLCSLHAHWSRGYAYSLNTRVSIEHECGDGKRRCRQRWRFL